MHQPVHEEHVPAYPRSRDDLVGKMLCKGEPEEVAAFLGCPSAPKHQPPLGSEPDISRKLKKRRKSKPKWLRLRQKRSKVLDVAPVDGGDHEAGDQHRGEKPAPPARERSFGLGSPFLVVVCAAHPLRTPEQPLLSLRRRRSRSQAAVDRCPRP